MIIHQFFLIFKRDMNLVSNTFPDAHTNFLGLGSFVANQTSIFECTPQNFNIAP